jgi:hypothetical protein
VFPKQERVMKDTEDNERGEIRVKFWPAIGQIIAFWAASLAAVTSFLTSRTTMPEDALPGLSKPDPPKKAPKPKRRFKLRMPRGPYPMDDG